MLQSSGRILRLINQDMLKPGNMSLMAISILKKKVPGTMMLTMNIYRLWFIIAQMPD
jgi:hypothetical protein